MSAWSSFAWVRLMTIFFVGLLPPSTSKPCKVALLSGGGQFNHLSLSLSQRRKKVMFYQRWKADQGLRHLVPPGPHLARPQAPIKKQDWLSAELDALRGRNSRANVAPWPSKCVEGSLPGAASTVHDNDDDDGAKVGKICDPQDVFFFGRKKNRMLHKKMMVANDGVSLLLLLLSSRMLEIWANRDLFFVALKFWRRKERFFVLLLVGGERDFFPFPTTNGGMPNGSSVGIYRYVHTLYIRFCTFGASLYSTLSRTHNKYSASELSRKFMKSTLLVGLPRYSNWAQWKGGRKKEGWRLARVLFFLPLIGHGGNKGMDEWRDPQGRREGGRGEEEEKGGINSHPFGEWQESFCTGEREHKLESSSFKIKAAFFILLFHFLPSCLVLPPPPPPHVSTS